MVEVKGRKFTVILREEPEGGYSAQCIELLGAISQGQTRKQTIANIREAIKGYLEAFPGELNQLKLPSLSYRKLLETHKPKHHI